MVIAAGALSGSCRSAGHSDPGRPRDAEHVRGADGGSGPNVTFEEIKRFLVGTIVVFALISAALYALVALNVRKGKNWARILGTVFAALSVFSFFPLSLAPRQLLSASRPS